MRSIFEFVDRSKRVISIQIHQKCSFSTKLIHDYVNSGNLKVAESLWNTMKYKNRNVKLYGFMMNAYIKHKQYNKCLQLFQEMNQRKMKINQITYLIVFKACNKSNNFQAAKSIHSDIINKKSIYKNIEIQNSLIQLYSKLDPSTAFEIYDNLPKIKLKPTNVTYLAMMKLIADTKNLKYGVEIHENIKQTEQYFQDIKIQNSLISMYGKCGDFDSSLNIFNQIKNNEINNCKIDDITYLNMIKICSIHNRLDEGKLINKEIKHLITNIKLQNSLIEMYSNCNDYQSAINVFYKMKRRDVLTYSLILKVCAKKKDIQTGKEIHDEIEQYLETDYESFNFVKSNNDIWIYHGLIDMYSKCGDIKQSEKIWNFINSNIKYQTKIDIVSYGTIMNALTQEINNQYYNKKALKVFDSIIENGLMHNDKTIVIALNACSNLQLLDTGKNIYDNYENKHKLDNIFIQNSMIALFSSCNEFNQAWDIYNDVKVRRLEDDVTFVNMLNACGVYRKNVEISIVERDIYSKYQDENIIDIRVYNALLNGYMKCDNITKCKQHFDKITKLGKQDIITYNHMFQTYVNNNCYYKDELLQLYQDLKMEKNVQANSTTYRLLINIFVQEKDIINLKKIHEDFLKDLSRLHLNMELLKEIETQFAKFI